MEVSTLPITSRRPGVGPFCDFQLFVRLLARRLTRQRVGLMVPPLADSYIRESHGVLVYVLRRHIQITERVNG
jgi:hypothetical protein